MLSTVAFRYSFPDPSLFDLIPAMGEIVIAEDTRVLDLIPPDMAWISIVLSGRWSEGPDPDGLAPGDAEVILHGPTSRARWYRAEGGTGFLVALHPLAWSVLFGRKAGDFADASAPLAPLIGGDLAPLVRNMLTAGTFEARVGVANAFFSGLPRKSVDPDLANRLMAMRAALADPDCASVDELAARVGLPQTRLARLSRACFGFTPKLMIQRERFRRMLHRADAHSYAEWRAFIEAQYVDQSHMIRDFKRFLGLSPSRYFGLERPIISAAFAEARRLLGTTPMES